MTNTLNFARKALRGGTALQALALLGAGVGMISIAAPAAAQDFSQVNATGRIQGTDGKPIAGATVTVTSNGQGFTRTVTTGDDGTFRVSALPQGTYTFTIEASGYDSFTDNAVTLSQSGAANQFTLAAAGAAASGDIVVTAGRVQVVDFDRNTTGAVINIGELATRVPVARDLTSIILLAPGTALGDTAFGNLPSIAGSSVSENTFYVNGLNTTSFRNGLGSSTVPFEFYQTVDIKNGGIPAEFGRFTGGFVNATTKSGSNEFHGGVTFNYEPDSLASDQPNTYATDNDSRFRERKDFIAQLSGPIIKDHLFFYGIYNSRDVQTAVGSTAAVTNAAPATTATAQQRAVACQVNPTFCSPFAALPAGANLVLAGSQYLVNRSTTPFYAGKLDAVIVDGQRLEFTYFNTGGTQTSQYYGTSAFSLAGGRYNPNTNEPGLAVAGGAGGTAITRFGGENYVGRYTGTFTNWLTLSAAYGVNKNVDTTESSAPNFGSIADQRFGTTISLGNPVSNTSISKDKRTFYRADGDINFNLFGSHHIRGGYDREELESTTSTIANGNYQYTYGVSSPTSSLVRSLPTGTQYVSRRYFKNGGEFSTLGEAFYIQDSWSLLSNRVLINAGVRNDHFENKDAFGTSFFNSKNNWSPRLSASFDPIGDGQTKIYGSFSRYYLPVPLNTNIRLSGSELDYDQYYVLAGLNSDNTPILGAPIVGGTAGAGSVAGLQSGRSCPTLVFQASGVNNCRLRNDGTYPTAGEVVSANLQAQSVDEYQVGFEQRLGRRVRIGAYYTQRDLRESLEDAVVDNGVLAYCNRTFTGAANAAKLASCQSTFTGFHQYTLINPGKDATVDLAWIAPGETGPRTVTLSAADLGYPQAKRSFKSMTLTFDREFDGKWSLSANYTISATVGNIEGGVRSDNGQTDANLTTAFDVPALVNGAYGYLPTHARHVIKAYGSYQLFSWLNVGANVNVVSPRKFGCIGTVPVSVDGGIAAAYGAAGYYCNVTSSGTIATTTTAQGSPAYTTQLTPRGSVFQSDWQYTTNLDLAIKLPTDAFDGTLRVSVFNVLNSKAKTDFQEVGTTAGGAPSSTYSLPLSYQTPRYVRFQLGVNF